MTRRDGEVERILRLLRAELCADACVVFSVGGGVSTVRALAGDGHRFGIVAGSHRSLAGAPTLAALFPLPLEINGLLAARVPFGTRGPQTMLCALRGGCEPRWGADDEHLVRIVVELIRERIEAEAGCPGAAR